MQEKHTTAPARTGDEIEPRAPLARKTYDNIYPLFAHNPDCRCCHPNDRPYCPCPCHTDVSRGEARFRSEQLRRDEVPTDIERPAPRRADPRVARLPGRVAG